MFCGHDGSGIVGSGTVAATANNTVPLTKNKSPVLDILLLANKGNKVLKYICTYFPVIPYEKLFLS